MSSSRPYLRPVPLALAHRGGALYGPNVGLENTLTAFRNAVQLGYTHLETDVHITSDGRLIAFHDDRLDRVTDGTGLVKDLPWSEVRQARIHGHERIPLLTEVLDELPGTKLNIDLKAPGTAEPAWELIRSRGLFDDFCVGSFSQRLITRFRRLSVGRVATAASIPGTALMSLGPRWVSAMMRTPADVFQVPTVITVRGRTVAVVTPKLVELAHRFGKQVHVWTIDDATEMERLLDLGVDGIVTDRIDVFKSVLVGRGCWTGR
ncbi:MAG: glycerophosphodiester phosphodiesterase [Intrasporangium sp.]|uniref:glycerophosphodiester phosphodiesterase n=1 Tax=Intrasporangium sp. TaxID=1925024 RepID=UPI00264A2FC0|nr:glycerophosphodiester phosphodiesterase [Intrasporangium sp.]MDN5795289.1 glycerophosphodiester phosphodiesterase [Intrasporangium sp.]